MHCNNWSKAIIWNLLSCENCTLWADWVKSNRVKNKSFWEVNMGNDSPWTLRKILKLRKEIKIRCKMITDNGKITLLWLDNWHPKAPLVERYCRHVVYDFDISYMAKIKEVINRNQWKWPSTNSMDLMEIKSSFDFEVLRGWDKLTWLLHPSGKFYIRSSWN